MRPAFGGELTGTNRRVGGEFGGKRIPLSRSKGTDLIFKMGSFPF